MKAVDNIRVTLKKNPKCSCKASECCLVTDIGASPVEMNRKSLKIEARKGQTVDFKYFAKYEGYNVPNNKK